MIEPVDPGPSHWALPDPSSILDDHPLVGIGADLEPATILDAYRRGMFPMPLHEDRENGEERFGALGWWSPDPRGILPLDGVRVTRSLRRSARDHVITIDSAFPEVLERCADPGRDGRWISDEIIAAYTRLHEMGWVHSVEARDRSTGELVGGLYGVHIGGFFAGESMFHSRRDGSKVALLGLVDRLRTIGATLLDVQWLTPHLASLGAVEIPRTEYLSRLALATSATSAPFVPEASS